MYGVSSGYIQRYSRLILGFFSSSAKKFPRAGPCPLLPRTKKNLGFGAISLYIALRDPIYTLYIYIYIYRTMHKNTPPLICTKMPRVRGKVKNIHHLNGIYIYIYIYIIFLYYSLHQVPAVIDFEVSIVGPIVQQPSNTSSMEVLCFHFLSLTIYIYIYI